MIQLLFNMGSSSCRHHVSIRQPNTYHQIGLFHRYWFCLTNYWLINELLAPEFTMNLALELFTVPRNVNNGARLFLSPT